MPVSNDWLIIMVKKGTISYFIIFINLLLMLSVPALGLGFKPYLLTETSVTFLKTKRLFVGFCKFIWTRFRMVEFAGNVLFNIAIRLW